MGANGFLARTQNENCHEPFADRNVRILKDGSDCDRKLIAASATLVKTLAPWSLAANLGGERIDRFILLVFTMRANRAIGPAQ